jgi:peptidoglycan/LPS O-acetylase OafA/YrhL
MAFSLTCFGDLCQHSTKELGLFIESLLVPFAFLLFLGICIHQRGDARMNFSRWMLESELFNFIGYGSYPIYLIQNVFLQYYFTMIFHIKGYDYHPTNPGRGYFQQIPLYDRFIAIIVVILIGWAIQVYLQDYLVANAFSKVLMWWSEAT